MSNTLQSVHPELVSEWSDKNLPLTPDKITFGSNKRVWWKGSCGHEWQASVKARSGGEKCPICSGARVVEGINDLATLKPQLAQEWSKKNELKPTEVSVASHKKVIWKCKNGHEWTASIKSRTVNGTGCPYCSHNKVPFGNAFPHPLINAMISSSWKYWNTPDTISSVGSELSISFTHSNLNIWLQERLKLEISEEKSKIVNLKKGYSEFLGFKLTLMKKGASYVVKSHICDKAKRRETDKLKGQIKKIAHPKNDEERATLINEYNSMIMGMHNYFQIATCVSSDFADMGREVDVVKLSQLKRKALSAKGDYKGFSFIEKKYGKSKQIRFYSGKPLIPVAYVKHKNPMWKKKSVCKYTPEGRREIHKNLGMDTRTMLFLMRTKEVGRSVEYMDNRISLYVAQYGKCAITGKILELHEIHCHHKKPVSQGGNDRYENLTILHKDIHRLLHATKEETIKAYLSQLQLTYKQKAKLNKLRQLANMQAI